MDRTACQVRMDPLEARWDIHVRLYTSIYIIYCVICNVVVIIINTYVLFFKLCCTGSGWKKRPSWWQGKRRPQKVLQSVNCRIHFKLCVSFHRVDLDQQDLTDPRAAQVVLVHRWVIKQHHETKVNNHLHLHLQVLRSSLGLGVKH